MATSAGVDPVDGNHAIVVPNRECIGNALIGDLSTQGESNQEIAVRK